jgi:hypothetical protein
MDAAFARNVAAKKRYKGNELDPDAEYDYDGGLEMWVFWGAGGLVWGGAGPMATGGCSGLHEECEGARGGRRARSSRRPASHQALPLPPAPRFENKKRRGDPQQQAQRDKARQVAAFNRQQKAEDACGSCFSSARRPRHMTIAIGQSTYLSLVSKGRLSEGHCYIAPAEHIASMRQVRRAAVQRCGAGCHWGA